MYLCRQKNTLLPSWLHVDPLRLVTKTLFPQIFSDHNCMFEPCTLVLYINEQHIGEESHDWVEPIRVWKFAP